MPNINFHGNTSSGSRAVTCEQTGMTKLIGTIRDYANAPKNKQNSQFEDTIFKISNYYRMCETAYERMHEGNPISDLTYSTIH